MRSCAATRGPWSIPPASSGSSPSSMRSLPAVPPSASPSSSSPPFISPPSPSSPIFFPTPSLHRHRHRHRHLLLHRFLLLPPLLLNCLLPFCFLFSRSR